MNLRQPPLSAELGVKRGDVAQNYTESHLYTGGTFETRQKKQRRMEREGNVQSKQGQGFAVESVLIVCHLSSARTESKN